MLLFLQCLILCSLFTLLILPAQYRDPFSQFASYPTKIRQRVYSLPQYKSSINKIEKKNWKRKILGSLLLTVLFAVIAFYSGKRSFTSAFAHVFVLFSTVNLYDLIVLDLIIFCHSKKLMIPGTEDMIKDYRNPKHHIIGALKGCLIGIFVALISAFFVVLIGLN